MVDNRDAPVTNPWHWPAQWVREEKFWRDIGARVLAGVLTAGIVYAGAVVLGYLHTPEVGAGVMFALICAGGVVLAASGVGVLLGLRRHPGTQAVRMAVGVVLMVLALTLLVGGVASLTSG